MTETHLTAKENMDQKEPILLAGILHCYKCDVLPQSICFNKWIASIYTQNNSRLINILEQL